MNLTEITENIGDYTSDCILICEAAPVDGEKGDVWPRIVWCNSGFTALTGYSLEEVKGKNPRILQGRESPQAPIDDIRTAMRDWQPCRVVVRNYKKSGVPFWSELSILPVADPEGKQRFWVSTQRDVTERTEHERALAARNRALQDSERLLLDEKLRVSGVAAVAEHSQDLITITDLDFRILWANQAFARRSGYPAAAIRGEPHNDLLSKRGETFTMAQMGEIAIRDGDVQDPEVRNIDRDGNTYWTDMRVSVQSNERGQPERFVVVERDITEQRKQRLVLERSRKEVAWAALHDPLTGLPNRHGFDEGLRRMAVQAERLGHGLGLLHLDLDRFKQINDTLGHAAGDTVLCKVTERIQRHLGPESFVARIGGDEFLIAVEIRDPRQDLSLLAEHIRRDASCPVPFDPSEIRFSVSVGHATAMHPPFELDALMVKADMALYRAKSNGRNNIHAFSESLAAEIRARKTLSDEINLALDQGDFLTFYQPQINATTGALAGLEALVRWDHPTAGFVGPEFFLPLARELNLEAQIDKLIMESALHDLEQLRRHGVDVPKVSVNVSSRRLRKQTLVQEVADLDFSPGSLSFELLESTFLDDSDDQILWTLSALRERGVGIEIDDFGTGHASIMGLVRVQPDRLKIDRSLIGPATLDPSRKRLFELIVEIGETLGIAVTAEGIETADHVALATRLGCSVLQGYYFSKPVSVDQIAGKYQLPQTGTLGGDD